MACPSIWLPSTTGRRSSLRATVTKLRLLVVGRAHIHDVDQMRGVAPGGEALDRHVPRRVPCGLVRDLDQHPILVEGDVAGELGQRLGRPQVLGQAFERRELDALSTSVRGK